MLKQKNHERRALLSAVSGTAAVLVAMLLIFSYWTEAGAQSNSSTSVSSGIYAGSITVVGEGSVGLEPDIARATIGVETVDESAREASRSAQAIMDTLLESLIDAGIAARDIETSGFSIFSERGTATDPDAVRYRVNNQVLVTIRTLDRVGEILDIAIEAGANQIYGVEFTLENPADHAGEARSLAVQNARAKAEELAGLADAELGMVLHVSEVIGEVGVPMQEMAMADGRGSATPILPGEFDLTVQIQVTYALNQPEASLSPATPAATTEAGEATVLPAPLPSPATSVQARRIIDPAMGMGNVPLVTVEGGDEATLRRYLGAMLQPIYPGAERNVITLTVGTIPADLPFALDLPAELEVLGTTVRAGDMNLTDVMLAGPAPVGPWLEELEAQLLEQGYFVPEGPDMMGGSPVFQGPPTMGEVMLCSEDRRLMLNLMGGELKDEAMIRIISNDQVMHGGICQPNRQMDRGYAPWLPEGILPTLQAPAGVTLRGTGTSGSDRMLEVTTEVTAPNLTVEELYQEWADQLAEQGWTRSEEDLGNAFAWSQWSQEFEGETWDIVFYVMRKGLEADRYTGSMHIELVR